MAARSYFAGSNTGRGYEHFFEELLPRGEDRRVCLLRGGAGTGKLKLLKELAEEWQAQGREVVCYPAADAPHLPEAVVSGSFAAVDAAAPHVLEMEEGDAVIDLSQAVDVQALRPWRGEAAMLARRAQALRGRAWRCLHVAHTALGDTAAIYAEAADAGALCNLRLELAEWLTGTAGTAQRVFARAVTPEGVISHADSLLREHTLCLDLPWGLDADAVLYPLAVGLYAHGTGYTAGMQLLHGGRMAHLCTDTHAVVSFAAPGCERRTLPLDEAVLRRERDALAFNRAAYDLWLRQGVEALSAARECRDRLERMCGDALRPEAQRALFGQARAVFA